MYSIVAAAYVHRAQARLAEQSKESLFYAAFELRCGIEARLQEYLEPHDHISVREKRDYHIRRLGKSVKQVTHADEPIVRCAAIVAEEEVFSLYYTPVRESLRKAGEQLGDLLHAPRRSHADEDSWWVLTRRFLLDTWQELAHACLGELLGSPILDKESGKGKLNMVIDAEVRERISKYLAPGTRLMIGIELIDEYPPELLDRAPEEWKLGI